MKSGGGISYQEILAWQTLTDRTIRPDEIRVMFELESDFHKVKLNPRDYA